jgi:hypothetical protein
MWKPDDKSGSWAKLKPDYFHMQEVWLERLCVCVGSGEAVWVAVWGVQLALIKPLRQCMLVGLESE